MQVKILITGKPWNTEVRLFEGHADITDNEIKRLIHVINLSLVRIGEAREKADGKSNETNPEDTLPL